MTAIEQWIKDAVDGGWNPIPQYLMPWMQTLNVTGIDWSGGEGDQRRYTIWQILLLPEAWQAVGKTRGWGKLTYTEMWGTKHVWEHNWHQFIDLLVDGLTIEAALLALENKSI